VTIPAWRTRVSSRLIIRDVALSDQLELRSSRNQFSIVPESKIVYCGKTWKVAAAFVFFICGCHSPSKMQPKQAVMGWRPVASWSGSANYQTDSFNIGTGQWRIKWHANEQPSAKQETFRVLVHSAVSGRFVTVAVDHPGAGSGTAYVAEDPREFFLVVESSGLDWKIDVEEGAVGE
jgi:hypothetical protein